MTKAKLPGLPKIAPADPALARWVAAVTERLEVREGARGDDLERVLTVRDLGGVDLPRVGRLLQGSVASSAPGGLVVDVGGVKAAVSAQAFADAIRSSSVYRSLLQRIDDPSRFDAMAQEVQSILERSLLDEAVRRGADISRVDLMIQEQARSLAVVSEMLTAAVETAQAGVREVQVVSATADEARAEQISQLEARLSVDLDPTDLLPALPDSPYATLASLQAAVPAGDPRKFYRVTNPDMDADPLTNDAELLFRWDGAQYVNAGTGTSAKIEERMSAVASRTDGLEAQYTLKLNAGGAVAGIGLAATSSTAGVGSSALILQADKIAFVGSSETVGTGPGEIDPTSPGAARIPFGVDTVTGTVFINGSLKVGGATGPTLDEITSEAGIYLSYSGQFFKYDATGNPVNTTVTLTANVTGTLTGTLEWAAISGYSGSMPADVTVTAPGAVSTATINVANMTGDTAAFSITLTDGAAVYSDFVTLVKLRDGADSYTAGLTNDSAGVATTNAGVPLTGGFGNATSTMEVYRGATKLTSGVTYSVLSNPQGLTCSINSSSGAFSVTGAGSWPSATNTALVTLRAVVSGGPTLTKDFTLTKNRQAIYTDYIFYRTTGTPPTPPTGWSDTPPTGAGSLYMSQATRNVADDSLVGAWSAAVKLDGDTGTAGPYTEVQYAKNSSSTTAPTTGYSPEPPTLSAGEFLWMQTRKVTPPASAPAWGTAVRISGEKGTDGKDAVRIDLTNDSHPIPCDVDGANPNFTGATTTASVYVGSLDDSANWTWTTSVSGVTITGANTRTVTINGISADTGYVEFTATKAGFSAQTVRFSVYRAKGGGYSIVPSVDAVQESAAGAFAPASITFSARLVKADGATTTYATGRYNISSSTDGATWTSRYTSSANEASASWLIAAGTTHVRGTLYKEGGTSVVLDQETVPVVSDGINGVNAKTAILTADSLVFKANSANVVQTPDAIRLDVLKQNTTANVTWATSPTVTLYTAASGGSVVTQNSAVATSTAYLRKADFGANTKVTVTTVCDGITDAVTLVRTVDGVDAPVVAVSNPSHPLPSDSDGTVAVASPYAGSGTTLQVFVSGVACTITGVTRTGTGITPGAASGTGTTTATIAAHSAITSDPARVEYAIAYTKPDGTSGTAYAAQAIYKQKAGATGGPGSTGVRGNIVTKISGAWSATTAAAQIASIASAAGAVPTTPIKGDIVSYTGGAKECSVAGNPGTWVDVAAYIDGSLVVTGTIAAAQLAADAIHGKTFNVATTGYVAGGQTAYNTGAGFFLGYSGGAYKFSMGVPEQTASVNLSTNVFTLANHGRGNGSVVQISSVEGTMTGVSANTSYYVVSATTDTFKIAATPGGAEIDIGGNATSATFRPAGLTYDGASFAVSGATIGTFASGPRVELSPKTNDLRVYDAAGVARVLVGGSNGTAVYVDAPASQSAYPAVKARHAAVSYTADFENTNSAGTAVRGYASASTGVNEGVRGESNSPSGVGVRAVSYGAGFAVKASGAIDCNKTIRAAAADNSSPSVGMGVEVLFSGGNGYVQSYDRSNSLYKPLYLSGSQVTVNGAGAGAGAPGNLGIGATSFGGGVGVLAMLNATTAPAASIAGGILYVESGALKFRGASGTVTTLAAA